MAELADALVLETSIFDSVRVQVPLRVLIAPSYNGSTTDFDSAGDSSILSGASN